MTLGASHETAISFNLTIQAKMPVIPGIRRPLVRQKHGKLDVFVESDRIARYTVRLQCCVKTSEAAETQELKPLCSICHAFLHRPSGPAPSAPSPCAWRASPACRRRSSGSTRAAGCQRVGEVTTEFCRRRRHFRHAPSGKQPPLGAAVPVDNRTGGRRRVPTRPPATLRSTLETPRQESARPARSVRPTHARKPADRRLGIVRVGHMGSWISLMNSKSAGRIGIS